MLGIIVNLGIQRGLHPNIQQPYDHHMESCI